MPKVSVIIPCFNHGAFIDEAVDSVLCQTFRDFEIIVVDDGSDDQETKEKLNTLPQPVQVLMRPHAGVAAARNAAITKAGGEYILPLDADDRIHETYLEKAVRIMDGDEAMGIVYCRAELFGEEAGEWQLPEYSFEGILLQNMIFCTALMRKCDVEQAGGYNPNMKNGHEDWDLFLSLVGKGRKVHCIPEHLFFYRIREGSRTRAMGERELLAMYVTMMENHKALYMENLELWVTPLLRKWLSPGEEYLNVINSYSWRCTQPLRTSQSFLCDCLGRLGKWLHRS